MCTARRRRSKEAETEDAEEKEAAATATAATTSGNNHGNIIQTFKNSFLHSFHRQRKQTSTRVVVRSGM